MKNCEQNEKDCILEPPSWRMQLKNYLINHFLYVPSIFVSECKDTVEESEELLSESASGGNNASLQVGTQYSGVTCSVGFIPHQGIWGTVFLCPKCWNRTPMDNAVWPAKCVHCGEKFHERVEDLI